GHERLEGGLGNITLTAGDTLVLVPGKRFDAQRSANSREFVLINDLDSSAKLDTTKSTLVLVGFAAVIGASLLGVMPIIKGLLAYLLLLFVFGIVHVGELRRRFPVDIVVIVGSALSIAQLMISSGLSERMGQMFIQAFNGWGVVGG
ncbi:SLC13 family permease, partial [Vibrio diabolicus]|nr:SLC13 family permease [Vibrio diabolicus]